MTPAAATAARPDRDEGTEPFGVLLVAHAPLASAFARAARKLGMPVDRLAALDIEPGMLRREALASARSLIDPLQCEGWLVLTDLGGCHATYVLAHAIRQLPGIQAHVVPGLSMDMLGMALHHAEGDLASLALHLAQRGAGGEAARVW